MNNIVYETGTSLAVQELGHSMLSTYTKWGSYLERLDEEFIERSGTCNFMCVSKKHVSMSRILIFG